MESWISYKVDGDRARARSISYGYGDSDPYIVACNEDRMVIRIPSSMYWSSVGRSAASQARWYVITVRWDNEAKTSFHVTKVEQEETPGRKWRATRDRMVSEVG